MPLLNLCAAPCFGTGPEVVEVTPGGLGPQSPVLNPTLLASHGPPRVPETFAATKSDQGEERRPGPDVESLDVGSENNQDEDAEEEYEQQEQQEQQQEEPPHRSQPSLHEQATWQLSIDSELPTAAGATAAQDPVMRPRSLNANRPRRQTAEEVKAARMEQREQAKQSVRAFLEQNGFDSVKSSRRRMMSTSYPLHVAVKANNMELIQRLLRAGADPFKTNSAGRTPLELAQRLNSGGSHRKAVEVLKRSTRNGKHWVPWLRTASGGLVHNAGAEAVLFERDRAPGSSSASSAD